MRKEFEMSEASVERHAFGKALEAITDWRSKNGTHWSLEAMQIFADCYRTNLQTAITSTEGLVAELEETKCDPKRSEFYRGWSGAVDMAVALLRSHSAKRSPDAVDCDIAWRNGYEVGLAEGGKTKQESAPDAGVVEQSVWLIERYIGLPQGSRDYWIGDKEIWSETTSNAVRFARKEDAERVVKMQLRNFDKGTVVVCEHIWEAAVPAAGEVERLRACVTEYEALETEHEQLEDDCDRLTQALKPWAFLDAKDIRLIFTNAPEGREKELGRIIGVLSGPWDSHMETPDLTHAVKNAREALKGGA